MHEQLDNPAWHALTGPQSALAVRAGNAARFVSAVAPFCAIAAPQDDAYRDLAAILGKAPEARLFRPRPEPTPQGWRKTFEKPILQMVVPARLEEPAQAPRIFDLGAEDVPDMMALAARTKPGPFHARTRELGNYLGIRRDGLLVAMAGARFRLPGFVEISAVAVDPAYRGRGYARVLTAMLATRIRASGATSFLHVFPDNEAAARLYATMGFVVRAELTIVWLARA